MTSAHVSVRTGRRHSSPRTGLVLFRVAAGPRLGHGHLRRAEVLAGVLGWPAGVSIRGAGQHHGSLARVATGGPGETLDAARPAVLVLDDPHPAHGRAWVAAATRRRIPVVSLHDLGLARVASTLAVDGSVVSPEGGWPARRVLRGLGYAVIARPRRRSASRDVRRVLVTLGGGSRATLTRAIVAELERRYPRLEILVTHGWPEGSTGRASRVRIVRAPDGLAPWFARVDLAVVGGGVSLYEAVAAGLPTVAVPVVPAQHPTIRAFARLGLTVDGAGRASSVGRVVRRIADRVGTIAADDDWRHSVWRDGPRVVDGHGAERVARAIAALSGVPTHA